QSLGGRASVPEQGLAAGAHAGRADAAPAALRPKAPARARGPVRRRGRAIRGDRAPAPETEIRARLLLHGHVGGGSRADRAVRGVALHEAGGGLSRGRGRGPEEALRLPVSSRGEEPRLPGRGTIPRSHPWPWSP